MNASPETHNDEIVALLVSDDNGRSFQQVAWLTYAMAKDCVTRSTAPHLLRIVRPTR